MEYNSSIIAIKGKDLQKAEQLFKAFRYFDLKSNKSFSVAEDAITYLSMHFSRLIEEDDVVIRGLWSDQYFTYYYDPETTDATDEDALEDLAKKINTDIYVFIIQEETGTYEFAWYNNKGQARYFSLSGKDLFNDGTKLPEEAGINLNEKTNTNDLLKLAANLGVDIAFKNVPAPFVVKELGYNEDL
jgi:hypothetical protein